MCINFQDLLCWGWVHFKVTHTDMLKHVRSVSKQRQTLFQRTRETFVLVLPVSIYVLDVLFWFGLFLLKCMNLNLEHLLGGAFPLLKQKLLNSLQG